jgi:hypothetical protein
MLRRYAVICFSLLVLFSVTQAHILDENSRNLNYKECAKLRVSSKLYEYCLQTGSLACLGYKLFNIVASDAENTTHIQSDCRIQNGIGRHEMEDRVDSILLKEFLEFLTPSSSWSSSNAPDMDRRKLYDTIITSC